VLNLRLTAIAPGAAQVTLTHHGGDADAAPVGQRAAWCPLAADLVPHQVYRRSALGAGFACDGPAIIEENESTTIAGRGSRVSVDVSGSLLITLPGGTS
jgi:N-methylhydantoinase A